MKEMGELYLSDTLDTKERGCFTIIESTAVDGNVADVYGDSPEESAANAQAIVNGMNELAALRKRVAALDDWLFEKMGQLQIGFLSFQWGTHEIIAFDFDGDLVAEAETLARVFELAAQPEGGE